MPLDTAAVARNAIDRMVAEHDALMVDAAATEAVLRARVAELEQNQRPDVPETYTVAAGDTLLKIGRRYLVQVHDIKAWNRLTSDALAVGQRLWLRGAAPGPAPVPEPEPEPEPAPRRLVVGIDLGQNAWASVPAHRAMLGGLPLRNCRIFFQPGEAPVWSNAKLKLLTPADTPWISTKTLTETTFRAFLDTMPAAYKIPGAVYNLSHQHEGEAEMLKSADPAAAIKAYLDTYAMIVRVLADHPNGKYFQPWKILLRYTQAMDTRAGFKDSWPRFVGDQDIPVGMDCYWPPQHKTYMPGAELLAKLLEIHAKTGLRISVPEVGGVPVGGPDGRQDLDGSKRAAAITELIEYAATTPVEYLNWWCGEGAATEHSAHHLEVFPSNVAAWVAGMRKYG